MHLTYETAWVMDSCMAFFVRPPTAAPSSRTPALKSTMLYVSPQEYCTTWKDNHSPVWEEEFEIGHLSDAAKAPFVEAIALALGKEAAAARL